MEADFASAISDGLRDLRDRVVKARRRALTTLGDFFTSLSRHLVAAAAVEAELEHRIASRFNVFDYLRDDELGLSRVVADLLDPGGTHGQKMLFLRLFLRLINSVRPNPFVFDERWLEECAVVVTRERPIETDEPDLEAPRRLDVCVELTPPGQNALCIAIENKPYAGDGDNQVNAYRQWLCERYKERFLLIYLSPHGGRPGYNSLPLAAPTQGVATMSFCPTPASSTDDRLPRLPALTGWLAQCSQLCQVDRLRWFLRDAETFCHHRFGGTMTTPSEQEEVKRFVLESDDNLRTALAVFDSWPRIRNDVVARFLARLSGLVEEGLRGALQSADDLRVRSSFSGSYRNDGVWAYRPAWSASGGTRPYVWLAHDSGDPKSWYLGVGFDPRGRGSPEEELIQERLSEERELRDGSYSANWPWYRYLDGDLADWSPLIVRLHQEAQEPGDLLRNLATEFRELAAVAIPIIDEVLEPGSRA